MVPFLVMLLATRFSTIGLVSALPRLLPLKFFHKNAHEFRVPHSLCCSHLHHLRNDHCHLQQPMLSLFAPSAAQTLIHATSASRLDATRLGHWTPNNSLVVGIAPCSSESLPGRQNRSLVVGIAPWSSESLPGGRNRSLVVGIDSWYSSTWFSPLFSYYLYL